MKYLHLPKRGSTGDVKSIPFELIQIFISSLTFFLFINISNLLFNEIKSNAHYRSYLCGHGRTEPSP